MIMTSYFFSVSGIVTIFLYWIYLNIKNDKIRNFKEFILTSVRAGVRILCGVMMSALLILPTFYALMAGRKDGDAFDFSILIPKICITHLLFSAYGMGLVSFSVFIIINRIFSKKKGSFFLAVVFAVLICFPFTIYLLNGTLYIDAKVLIPFLPLFAVLTAEFMEDFIPEGKVSKPQILIYSACIALGLIGTDNMKLSVIAVFDCLITIIVLYMFDRTKRKMVITCGVGVLAFLNFLTSNTYDTLIPKSEFDKANNKDISALVNDTLKNDDDFYRVSYNCFPLMNVNRVMNDNYNLSTCYSSVYNKKYRDFYYNIMNNEIMYRNSVIQNPTHNVLFNILMGNKYIFSHQSPAVGYKEVMRKGNIGVYKNKNVYPLGFASSRTMNINDYRKLSYPENEVACVSHIITDKSNTKDYTENVKKFDVSYKILKYSNLSYSNINGEYIVNANDNAAMTLDLKEPLNDETLFLEFNVDSDNMNMFQDCYIIINGVKNKLTSDKWKYHNSNYNFNYVISSDETIDKLDIKFKKGSYKIRNINGYVIDNDYIDKLRSTIIPLSVDRKQTNGDVIKGKIDIPEDETFLLTIPYDKGFDIKVNNKKVSYTKANDCFISFPVSKGENKITVTYNAPLKNAGIVVSIAGIIFTGALITFESIKKKKKVN